MMNIKGKNKWNFNFVELESINENSDYKAFIKGEETSKNVFGTIIVCKDVLGRTREIISGKHIPVIEITQGDLDLFPVMEIPYLPYRGRYVSPSYSTEETIKEYIKNNSNEEYVNSLDDFINSAKLCKKRNFTVRKLIRKLK